MTVVEQGDAEGVAEIGDGAGQAEPRRCPLVLGDDQVMAGGELLDRLHRRRIGAVLVA